MINFFQARDELNRVFLRGSDMPAGTRAVFRHLLECTLYSEDGYGWVRHDACGIETISKITGISVRSVKDHLVLLEKHDLISRHRRFRGARGRLADQIRIEWDVLYQGADFARAESAPTEADQGAKSAPTFYIEEKNYKNPAGGVVVDLTSRRAHG